MGTLFGESNQQFSFLPPFTMGVYSSARGANSFLLEYIPVRKGFIRLGNQNSTFVNSFLLPCSTKPFIFENLQTKILSSAFW